MCVCSMMVDATSLSLPVWHTFFVHIIHRSRKEEKKVTKKKREKGRGNKEKCTAIGGKVLLVNMLSRFLPDTDSNSCCQCHSSHDTRTGKWRGGRILSFLLFVGFINTFLNAYIHSCHRVKRRRRGRVLRTGVI